MTSSLRLSTEQKTEIDSEQLEDEYDLKACAKAMAIYRENPVVYPLEKVEKELGLM